jgi:mannosyltransferase
MIADEVQRPREQAERIWTRYRVGPIALSLTLLGAALRLYRIDANGFTHDEIWSIWISQFNVPRIVQLTFQTGDGTPPAYFVGLHALLLIGQEPLTVRALSVLAGTLMVWLTFHLALDLFDLRIAALSAGLIAIAPLHIACSQLARAYVPGSLAALFSLYFFGRILFQRAQWYHWVGLVAATAVGLWTYYLPPLLLVFFQNVCVGLLWFRRRLSRSTLVTWSVSQAVLIILTLPCLRYVLFQSSPAGVWEGQSWIPRPGLQSLVKSAILFSTGDPSYGPTGVTPARVLSLVTIAGIAVLGACVFLKRGYHFQLNDEGRRVLFLIGAILVPWAMTFVISQDHPIYKEKYLIFLMPQLFILFAWIFTQTLLKNTSKLFFVLLTIMTASALVVYYREPSGEQWREAISYVRSSSQAEDLAIISPGFYFRPFAYYFSGEFPSDTETLDRAPAVVFDKGKFRVFDPGGQALGLAAEDSRSTTAQRVWFVSGYAPADPGVTKWIEQNSEPLDTKEFLGVHVRLLRRTRGS